MAVEETKHDLFLKRAQVTVAILAGLATLVLGIYNIKKNLFSKETPEAKQVVVAQEPAKINPLRSALEDAGASLIRTAANKYTHSKDQSASQSTQN